MRASDADRERVSGQLREHFGAGRLDPAELDQRLSQALVARTDDELAELTRDLPADASAPAAPATRDRAAPSREVTRGGRALRTSVKIHAVVFLAVNAMLVAVWALAGGGEFWPVWPLLGWGIGLAAHWAPVAAGVGTRPARPTSAPELAAAVQRDRPSLRAAAAPDGTVTLLFSDIADSTALNDRLGDDAWLRLLREHHRIVREATDAHGGAEVKAQGDGFMLAFPSARRALGCALAIQAGIAAAELRADDTPVRVRIGLHTGEAIREEEDFYGVNVALAARIAAAAQPGEVLVSDTVRAIVAGSRDREFGPPRDVTLKGLGENRVYPVVA